ncbi:MAG TPA: NADH-quinone oxidoreductase subunit C [Dehalococcoidia bacterium]|nr:NADH-quinone oxidoreductase subunit C [Dehalococcoidia bacterium]
MTLPDGQDAQGQAPGPEQEPAAPGATPEQPAQEEMTAAEKLADPAATGERPNDPAASIEKTAESAAPAPEGAQPQDPATKGPPAAKQPRPQAERPARPAKEEAKGPSRVAPPAGSINEVLAAAVPDVPMTAYLVPEPRGESVAVEVPRDSLTQVMTALRDDERLQLDYMRCLSGVDWQEEGLEVVYHLWSMSKRHGITVKTRCPSDDARVPSVAELYPAANWHEREARDMFGIVFEGHPHLVPLLLPEDMTDHFPLRKDNPLQEIEEWQGENLREGAGEGDEE